MYKKAIARIYTKRKFLTFIIVLFGNIYNVNCQQFIEFDKEYRQQTYELLMQDKYEEIEVKYIGECKIPNLNIWETLYFHLIKGEFDTFFEKIEEYHSNLTYEPGNRDITLFNAHQTNYREYIFDSHTRDELWGEVKKRISIHPNELLSKIAVSKLDTQQQEFIEVFLYYMVWYFHRADEQVDSTLDAISQSYLQKYDDEVENAFIEKFIIPRITQSKFRLIMDVGTDYTILTESLNEYIQPNNGFTFSSKMLLGYDKYFIGLGFSVLDAKVKNSFELNDDTWLKDSTSNIANVDLIAGYSLRLHKNLSINPFVGYRFSSLRYSYTDIDDESSLITLSSNTPILGCYFDVEFLHNFWRKLGQPINKESYSTNHHGIRLGFQYAFSNFERQTSFLEGNMMLFSIKYMIEFRLGGKRRTSK